jgi:hypothetical protein
MAIDTSDFRFPKPCKERKNKRGSKSKKEEVNLYEKEVIAMIDFYEAHKNDMASVENFKHTKKMLSLASQWIKDVMVSQKCDDVQDVLSAWEQTVIHAAEQAHSSHKVGSFLNFWWLIKNDSNYLDVIEGKYDKEFRKPKSTVGWGNAGDFVGAEGGPSGIVV